MIQKFELGQCVWAFKQQGNDYVKTSGVVRMAEINSSGYIQYQVKCSALTPTGERKEYTILANHASLAETEAEIDEKIKKYNAFEETQKEIFEKNFGAPEFDVETIDAQVVALAEERGQ